MRLKKLSTVILLWVVPFFLVLQPIQAGEASRALLASSEFSSEDTRVSFKGKYKGYNVILIILDALRPDFLSCYGYPKKTSPNIDALAKQGVVFENAFSSASLTLPCVTTIFTSLYPQSHNVRMISQDRVPERMYTLAQILNFYDYDTAWFGSLKDPHTGSADGLLKGFDEINEIWGSERAMVSWVGKHKRKPFFLTIHSYLTHEATFPYIALNNQFSRKVSPEFKKHVADLRKQGWNDFQDRLRTDPDSLYDILGKDWVERHKGYFFLPYSEYRETKIINQTEVQKRRWKLTEMLRRECDSFFLSMNQEQVAVYLGLLDSAVFEADVLIGSLVEKLKKENIFDKTLIVITADHGNEYRDHGMIGHGPFLYDESTHVPLIVYMPGSSGPVRKKELVESADILPSLLEWLEIPLPHQAQGLSFVDVIPEKKEIGPLHEFVFAKSGSGAQCIRSTDWKYIQNPAPGTGDVLYDLKYIQNPAPWTGDELYDLRNDPLEKKNVIHENEKVAEDLEKRLTDWVAGLPVYTESRGEFGPEVDERTRRNIRKTGYW